MRSAATTVRRSSSSASLVFVHLALQFLETLGQLGPLA